MSSIPRPVDLHDPAVCQSLIGPVEIEEDSRTLDLVTRSASLAKLAPRIRTMLEDVTGHQGSVAVLLSDNIDRLKSAFAEALYSGLADQGVDLEHKLTLRLGPDRLLALAGDHPQKDRVEATLALHPDLSLAFGEIAAQSEVLRDIGHIRKMVTSSKRVPESGSAFAVYQMSLKGEMNHFYFARP